MPAVRKGMFAIPSWSGTTNSLKLDMPDAADQRSVAERTEALGGTLHLASVEYEHAEQRLRGRLGNGPDGGPA